MKKNIRLIFTGIMAAASIWACDDPLEDTPDNGLHPEAPSGLKVMEQKTTETSLTFQWNPVENAEIYAYTLKQAGSMVQEGSVKTRNVELKGLSKATTYTFTVYSVAGDYKSEGSSIDAVTAGTPDADKPELPPVSEDMYALFGIPEYEEDGQARAFPGAEGGGMYATGGRGGSVYRVTNLNDSGEGSLRYGIESAGRPLTIVFDVAGVIPLSKQINITKGDLTIAGQTAPGDGICLKNYTFRISASNVIVRFIRCRMGDETATEDDAMQVMNHKDDSYSNIIIDHCSISWSTDECASFYGMKDFTFQWNIVSESLRVSVHEKGTHGYGGIWGGNNATYHHNLLAHHDSRNPRIDHDYVSTQKGPVSIFNNVVYNWSGNTCYGGESSDKNGSDHRKYNFFNNYYKPGPATPSNHIWFLQPTTSCSNCGGVIIPGHFYMDGNIMHGQNALSADNWLAGTKSPVSVYINASDAGKIKAETPYTTGTMQNIHSGEGCFEPVLAYAGASFARDAIDARIAKETKDKTATYKGSKSGVQGLIDTQTDVMEADWDKSKLWPVYSATEEELDAHRDSDGDGMPNWFERQFGLNEMQNDASAIHLDKNGRYTNLEMYLHYIVKDIVAGGNSSATYTKL